MADGKWIEGLTPGLPVVEAARRVLEVRLRVVRDALPRAVSDSHRDPEPVHELRVATRRADAALRIFRSRLPGRAYKGARRRLRALRRAAGEARDWDVFLAGLVARRGEAPAEERPGLDFLVGYAAGRRESVQGRLLAANEVEGHHFNGFANAILDSLHEPARDSPAPLLSLARPLLTRALSDLHRAAAGDLTDYDHLHQVRIEGKRLRYAMEVFSDCFPPPFKGHYYPLIEEAQETLGRANDSHVAAGRLAALRDRLREALPESWESYRAGVEGLLRFHKRRLPLERRRFLKWWDRWVQAGVEQALLAQPGAGGEPGA